MVTGSAHSSSYQQHHSIHSCKHLEVKGIEGKER